MAPGWRDEVREIVEKADQTDRPTPLRISSARRSAPPPRQMRSNPVELLGAWTRRRLGSTSDMLATAASLVVLALLLSVVARGAASVIALVGAFLFLVALIRAVIERRQGRAGSTRTGTVMWRGQVIELRQRHPSLVQRLRSFFRRR